MALRCVLLPGLLVAGLSSAQAAVIPFAFDAALKSGPLTGTSFSGTGSYDNSLETGVGTDYLTLRSLDFTLLGFHFTKAQISQGGQAILQNGTLSYFTAAYFVDGAPVQDIAFGFGGPGIIGYFNAAAYGDGVYTFSQAYTVPEPASAVVLAAASAGLATVQRRRRRRARG